MCAVANNLIVTLIHLHLRVKQKLDFNFINFFTSLKLELH